MRIPLKKAYEKGSLDGLPVSTMKGFEEKAIQPKAIYMPSIFPFQPLSATSTQVPRPVPLFNPHTIASLENSPEPSLPIPAPHTKETGPCSALQAPISDKNITI